MKNKIIAFFYKTLRIKKVILGRDKYYAIDVKCNKMKFGNKHAEWIFCPDDLDAQSIIYSFGVGKDISFDLSLIREFDCYIHAFDPTPSTERWINNQTLSDKFIYKAIGLSDKEEVLYFSFLGDNENVSASILKGKQNLGFEAIVKPLNELMLNNGHRYIDVLKMDIEGAEYDVINQLCLMKIPIRQILVEFHHRFDWAGINKTIAAISLLRKSGYQIFNISRNGEEYSFINKNINILG